VKLDDIVRSIGIENPGQTPTQQPNDNLSSQRSFYDHVINSVEYHDSKIRQKFKVLEFPGVVLNVKSVSDIELMERTSLTFAKEILPMGKDEQIYEAFIHIPEISGLLPQPTIGEMAQMSLNKAGAPEFDRKKYSMITSRFPRFYIVNERPRIFQVWKIKFPDENFFYYGLLLKMLQSESMLKNNDSIKRAILQQNATPASASPASSIFGNNGPTMNA